MHLHLNVAPCRLLGATRIDWVTKPRICHAAAWWVHGLEFLHGPGGGRELEFFFSKLLCLKVQRPGLCFEAHFEFGLFFIVQSQHMGTLYSKYTRALTIENDCLLFLELPMRFLQVADFFFRAEQLFRKAAPRAWWWHL
jgi:hypothetical protein